MYREELVSIIQECTDEKRRGELLGELYFANLGLIVTMCNGYGNLHNYRDDYMQLAYIALDKAVRGYNRNKGFSILSNYRLWLKHECYRFWCSLGGKNEVCSADINTQYENSENSEKMSKMFSKIEVDFMVKMFWERVAYVVGQRDYSILKKRFVENCTLRVIAMEQGITIERVRQRILKACSVLREDSYIREVAIYYNFL